MNRNLAEAFIAALTGSADTPVTFQTFDDRGQDSSLARILHGTLDQHYAELVDLHDHGAGSFIAVNETDLKGRKAENVVVLRALFVDFDGTTATPALAPSFVVHSVRGDHLYFLLVPGEPLEKFRPAQEQLAAFYASDPNVTDLPRVMRLPGFLHQKGEPKLVTFEMGTGARHTIADVLGRHPAREPHDRGRDRAVLAEGRIHDHKRNNTLCSLAGTMRRRGMTTEEIEPSLQAVNRRRWDPPLDDREVAEIARKIERHRPGESIFFSTTKVDPPENDNAIYVPRCYSLQDLVDNPPTDLEWVVDSLIQKDGITGLIGRPKVGKSLLLQLLGLCHAAPANFLGRTTKAGRVLYMDEEMGKAAMNSRWLRMCAADPAFDAPETRARFFGVSLGGLSIDQPDPIRREIEKAKPTLLIVDSFRRVFRGDENDSGRVAQAMAFCARLRSEYGLSIVISHHSRKSVEASASWEDAARGSSDFFAACDGLLGLGKNGKGKGFGQLRAAFRAAPELDPVDLVLNPMTLAWELVAGRPDDAAGFDSVEAIAEILRSKPERRLPQKRVAEELQTLHGRTEKQAEKALAKVPTVSVGAEPPGSVQLFKRPIPGTRNEREVILLEPSS